MINTAAANDDNDDHDLDHDAARNDQDDCNIDSGHHDDDHDDHHRHDHHHDDGDDYTMRMGITDTDGNHRFHSSSRNPCEQFPMLMEFTMPEK